MPAVIFPFEKKYRISSPYGQRIHPVTKKPQYHSGIDIAVPAGTPVRAVFNGIVLKIWNDDINGLAIRLLNRDQNLRAGYAHLQEALVKEGQVVKQGEIIALSGNSGRSTGPHLHLSIFQCMGWATVNPEEWM